MASGDDHPHCASPGPHYQFRLKAMRQNSTRVGSPGEMIIEWRLPVDGKRHDVDFVCRDEIATFVQHTKPSNGTKAKFCEL
jgi:hypothetical protein